MPRMRRPPSNRPPRPARPLQIEPAVTLVALAATVAGLVEALLAMLVHVTNLHPAWARSAAAIALAVAGLLSLGLARLRTGPAPVRAITRLRWAAFALAVATVGLAVAAAVR
jgi:cytochrome c biogenesis protein CcdA